jgi:hypothetical protein
LQNFMSTILAKMMGFAQMFVARVHFLLQLLVHFCC